MGNDKLRLPSALTNIDGIDETIHQICTDAEVTREQLQALLDSLDQRGLLQKDETYNGWMQ